MLVHQQGVERTTLAEVAARRDVPAGNVYYYFKTKDELVAASIDAHALEIEAMLASLDRHRPRGTPEGADPGIRRSTRARRPTGCPNGSLCQELDKRDDDLRPKPAGYSRYQSTGPRSSSASWADGSPRPRGRAHLRLPRRLPPRQHLPRPHFMTRQARRLERWIDSL